MKIFEWKYAKITKRSHVFKGYASSCNVEVLISFNPELQLNDTESVITNKLIDLLSELKGFKFVTTIVLESKKIERDDKTKYDTFFLNTKAETTMKVTLMMCLNQSILQLYQTYKNL